MATGGEDPELDPRKTCSICMESFRGRHPKLLPCFHTFCLPCLHQLTREGTQQLPQEGRERKGVKIESENGTRCTLLCPTCRAVTPVPSGGVAKMQNNFYIKEDSLPAPACDLCDGEQTAKYSCTKCPNKVCSQCRRYHDKCCQATGLIEINQKHTRDGRSTKKEQQIQLAEKVVNTLSNKKKRLAQESEILEHKIRRDQHTVQHLVNEACDATLKNIKTSTDQMADKLGREINEVDNKLKKLRRTRSGQSASFQNPQLDLLSEADVQHYQDVMKDSDEETLLEYKLDDTSMDPLMNSLSDFVSTVTQRSLGPRLMFAPEAASSNFSGNRQTSELQATETTDTTKDNNTAKQNLAETIGTASTSSQPSKDFAECKKLISALQADSVALRKEMAAITSKNTDLCATIATLEKDAMAQKEAKKDLAECGKLVKELQTDTQALHRGMTRSADKHMTLEKEMVALKETSTNTQGDLATLKTSLATEASSRQKDLGSLSQDVTSMKTDVGQLLAEKTSQNTDMSALQTDVTKLQSLLAALETKVAKGSNAVAFHAKLNDTVTTKKSQAVVICDGILTNIGNGYNGTTGIFTAPVTGTYCFMATTSPGTTVRNKKKRLDVMHNSKRIGYVWSSGSNLVTCHSVAKVGVGETVYLQSYDDEEYDLSGNWWTSFSGMLLQLEL